MASLDTNAILSLILSDRPDEKAVVTNLLKKQKLQVADMVFSELEYVFSKQYDYNRDEVAINFRTIANINNILCNRTLLAKALPLYTANRSLSFVDCCLVSYADLNGATPLYTSDKKLVNQTNGLAKLI